MAVSKKAATSKAAPKAASDNCAKCDAKIAALEKKIESLESKLKGLLDGIEAASKLKADLDEAKLKLGAEVNELKEKAKSWKEKADTNNDGSLSLSEVWEYITLRNQGKSHKRASFKAKNK